MTKATTPIGTLTKTGCTLTIGQIVIPLKILPDISDSKSAQYYDENVQGRSFPVKTYAFSENRSIGMAVYFYADTADTLNCNLNYCRAIQSATYPQNALAFNLVPYRPPPICSLSCGSLISTKPLCVILKRYNLKIPRDVQWDEKNLIPYFFTMDLEFDVVYNSSNLPGQDRILDDTLSNSQVCSQ